MFSSRFVRYVWFSETLAVSVQHPDQPEPRTDVQPWNATAGRGPDPSSAPSVDAGLCPCVRRTPEDGLVFTVRQGLGGEERYPEPDRNGSRVGAGVTGWLCSALETRATLCLTGVARASSTAVMGTCSKALTRAWTPVLCPVTASLRQSQTLGAGAFSGCLERFKCRVRAENHTGSAPVPAPLCSWTLV